jgi:hypothetical protein
MTEQLKTRAENLTEQPKTKAEVTEQLKIKAENLTEHLESSISRFQDLIELQRVPKLDRTLESSMT